MKLMKLTVALALALTLNAYAPAQDSTSIACDDRVLAAYRSELSLLEANADTFEISVKVLRKNCTSSECEDLAKGMEEVGKVDRKTAESFRSSIAKIIKAR